MSPWVIVIVCGVIILITTTLLMWERRYIKEMHAAVDRLPNPKQTKNPPPAPCYRCARPSVVEYMALRYCFMCREVIVAMIAAVRHDPPYGFPGAPGYLDYPDEVRPMIEESTDAEKKKEPA